MKVFYAACSKILPCRPADASFVFFYVISEILPLKGSHAGFVMFSDRQLLKLNRRSWFWALSPKHR